MYFNIYSLPAVFSLIISLTIGIYVIKKSPREKINQIFFLLVLGFAVFSIGEILIRSSESPYNALLSGKLAYLGVIFVPVILFHLSLLFPKRKIYSNYYKYIISILYIFSFLLLSFFNVIISVNNITTSRWGYRLHLDFNSYIIGIWVILLFSLSVLRFIWSYYTTESSVEQKQICYVFYGGLISFLLVIPTNIILPLLNIEIFPMTIISIPIFLIFVGWAIQKYWLFEKSEEVDKKLKRKIKNLEQELTEYKHDLYDANVVIQDSKDYLENIISSIFDLIIVIDEKGIIKYVNSSSSSITGFSGEELLKKDIFNFIPKETLSEFKSFFNESLNNLKSSTNLNHSLMCKDGSKILVESSYRNLLNNKVVNGILFNFHDITDYKKAEEKLKKAHNELERVLKNKDEFIHQLGHDLKTPLSPLINLLPLIYNDLKDEKLKERLEVCIKCVKYMRDLTQKTLDLAVLKSPNNKLDISDVNVFEEIKRITEKYEKSIIDKNITVKNNLDNNIILRIDKLRFIELFDNLFSNALKYTPKKGTIVIDANRDGDIVNFSLRDSGIGLDNDDLNRVFDEFYKADKSRHALDSSGIGLSICKRIVEKHGGRIWAESPGIGKGSTFHFSLRNNHNQNI